MRRPEWTWWAMAAGACVGVALLVGRGGATAVWVVLPLTAWLFAVTRGFTSAFAAGVQIAVIVGLAIATSGHLGVGPLSFWDAAFAYDVMAIGGCVGAWYAYQRPSMNGRYPRPTTLRRHLNRAEWYAVPVATVAVRYLGAIVVLPVVPPRPPAEIVFPLPADVRATDVNLLCGPGPTVTCTWSIDIEADETSDRLARVLERHLTRTKGWHLATSRCRTWGWIIKERACVTITLHAVLTVVTGAAPPLPVYPTEHLTIVVAYG